MFKKKRGPLSSSNWLMDQLDNDHANAELSNRINNLNEDLAEVRAKLAESEARYKVELEESNGRAIATTYLEYSNGPVEFTPCLTGTRTAKQIRVTDRKMFTYRVVKLSVPILTNPNRPVRLVIPAGDAEGGSGDKYLGDFYGAVAGSLYVSPFP